LAAAGVALALCGPWYAVNGPSAWRFFSEAGAFAREFDGAEATAAGGALYYAREVYRSGLWQPYTAILLLALPLALPRLARRPAAALLFWTLAPLLFQAIFVAPRVRRFLMPALPPLAQLLAAAVMALRAGWPRTDSPAAPGFPVGGVGGWGRGIRELARRALAPGVVAVGVAQFLFLSFVPGAAARFRPLEENQSSRAELRINNGLFKPDARDWGVARLDAMILPWARRLSRETRLAFIDVRPETSCGFDLLCLEGSGRPPVRSEALRGQTRPAPAVAPREIFTGGDLPDIVVVSRYRRDHVHGLFDVPSLDGVEAAFRARASEYLFLGEFEVGPDRCFVYVR
ncbi:MAG: hypothetical protein HY719_01740, partial [Planctomycetes bacterium]|nr:hypothetical protein [Planctomycetota bacterium]